MNRVARSLVLLLLFLSFATSNSLRAQLFEATPHTEKQPTGMFEISPFVGLRFGGGFENVNTGTDYNLDASPSYGITLDIDVLRDSRAPRLELLFSHQDTSLNISDSFDNRSLDVTVDVFQIGLIQDFASPDDKFRPYLAGLLGATRFASDPGSDVRFSLGLGGGIRYFPIKNLGLRLDLRGYPTIVESSGYVFCSEGCVIAYSGSSVWQGEITASLVLRF